MKDEQLQALLTKLRNKYITTQRIAEELEVTYGTVAHWYDGRSYPSFELTLRIMKVVGLWDGAF